MKLITKFFKRYGFLLAALLLCTSCIVSPQDSGTTGNGNNGGNGVGTGTGTGGGNGTGSGAGSGGNTPVVVVPATPDPDPDNTTHDMTERNLSENIGDGAILHVFCWSFNTIKDNMEAIANAGFSTIQTSPVSKCRAGENNNLTTPGTLGWGNDAWFYHYQPTEYVVGNYQLGTEAEFKAMCDKAHEYGIKVIVDAVLNHCTSNYSAISQNIKNLSNPFHDMSNGLNLTDRYSSTQYNMSGLYEWNTQNTAVQQYLLNFLKQCVADGADGFRYDAARCIELPDDDAHSSHSGFQSNFWPVILQNGSKFQYGEVLQEGGKNSYSSNTSNGYPDDNDSRLGAYQSQEFTYDGDTKHFNTTASFYGWRIRNAISNKNLNADYVKQFLVPSGAYEERVVTWVESHDNYYNDHTYTILDEEDVILAYAAITARKNGTPLFFDRPKGSSKGTHNHIEGDNGESDVNAAFGENKIGNAGSDMYKDSRVVKVNFFRNKLAGTDELLTNPVSGNNAVLMIQRSSETLDEKAGFVIINAGASNVTLSGAGCVLIKGGTYTDEVKGGSFTVSSGKISGTVNARSVVVVSEATASGEDVPAEVVKKSYVKVSKTYLSEKSSFTGKTPYCYAYYGEGDSAIKNANWPGVKMTEEGDWWVYEVPANLSAYNCAVIINNGSGGGDNQFNAGSVSYGGTLTLGTTSGGSGDQTEEKTLVSIVENYSGWSTIYCYAYYNEGAAKNAEWPGVVMTKNGSYWTYEIPSNLSETGCRVIFNNGVGGQGGETRNFGISKNESKLLDAFGNWVDR